MRPVARPLVPSVIVSVRGRAVGHRALGARRGIMPGVKPPMGRSDNVAADVGLDPAVSLCG